MPEAADRSWKPAGIESRRMAIIGGSKCHEDRTEDRAVQRAEAAHDDQQKNLDGQQDGEDVRRQKGDLVREQRRRRAPSIAAE